MLNMCKHTCIDTRCAQSVQYIRVIAKGGTASRPERRVEILYRKGEMPVEVCTLIEFVIKILPDIIKLAKLIAKLIKNKRRPSANKD